MPTAEQLLSGASTISYTGGTEVIEVDKKLYIDFNTRQILIPDCIHQLGVESDDDVKKLTFSVPKMYYDCDLSTFNIYINYMNAKKEGDLFKVLPEKVREVGENLEFDWIVGRNAVAYKGTAIFNVCMKKGSMQPDEEDPSQEIFVVDQEFNTTVAKLPVLEGLETGEEVAQEYADILMQWEEMLFGIENSATRNIIQKGSEVIEAVNAAGEEQKSQIALKGSEVISEITSAGETQRTAMIQKGSEVIQTIDTRKTEIGTAATQALSDISTAKNEVISESEAQIQAIILKGSEVVQTVNTAGENQVNAIEAKGTEVVNTVGEQLDIKIPAYIEANPDQFKGEKGDPGEKGEPGVNGKDGTSVTILDSYSTEAELRAAHPTGNPGDGYLVGGDLYIWNITLGDWKNVGRIQGPAGKDGQDGYTPQKGVDYFDGINGTNGKDGANGVSPTVSISKVGKVTTITITDASGPHTATINDGIDGTGSGDMSMATYDADGDGVVDNAASLGGVAADEYALKSDIPETPTMSITDDGSGNVTVSIGG